MTSYKTQQRPQWAERMGRLERAGLARSPRCTRGRLGPSVETADGEKLLFCSNDYLGLSLEPRLAEAMAEAARDYGVGAPSSRLVCGNGALHESVERRAAAFLGTEDAVLFPSGFQANLGALAALLDEGDTVFSDALNHASIVDGCRLSRAAIRVYRHGDAAHLDELLAGAPREGVRLVITEAVFSMDGDTPPLEALCETALAHGAAVYVDEAHALGVLGPGGRGLVAELGLIGSVDVRMGTFGKALGIAGAFVGCSAVAARLLRSRARSLLYTTATPPPLAAALLASMELAERADGARRALFRNVELFRERAKAAGIPLAPSTTPIQPVPIGGAARTMAVSEELWRRGVFVQGIRPPTVPEGSSRLRVTLTAVHSAAQIEALVEALAASLSATEGVS